jgi:hypothetical protein
MKRVFYLAVAAAVAVASSVRADTTLVVQGGDGRSTIQVSNGMGRMDTPDNNYLLYDSKRNLVIHVEPADGGYTELDEAQITQMAQMANSMRTQLAPHMEAMKAQLANLPPQQRAMIEQSMGAMMGPQQPAAEAPITVVRKGAGNVAGIACQMNELMQDGKHVGQACIATSAGGKLSAADFQTLEAMMGFLRRMASQASSIMGSMGKQVMLLKTDLAGVPLSAQGTGPNEKFEVTSVSNEKLAANLFTDYQSLRKKTIPGLGQ